MVDIALKKGEGLVVNVFGSETPSLMKVLMVNILELKTVGKPHPIIVYYEF